MASHIVERERKVSSSSELSDASTTVSDFLEEKICEYQQTINYLDVYKAGLIEARSSDKLKSSDFNKEITPVLDEYSKTCRTLKTLKRQKRFLEEDLTDELNSSKRLKTDLEPDFDFLERAYTSTVVPRVMGMAKQQKSSLNQDRFRKDVIRFYRAQIGESNLWCHLTGWHQSNMVKAAHLVPKSLSQEELSYLFGVREVPYDARNGKYLKLLFSLFGLLIYIIGITLHKKIEEAMDQGIITILPVPNDITAARWKCVLVDESLRWRTCFEYLRTKEKVIWNVRFLFSKSYILS